MCGRFTLTKDLKELAERFSASIPQNANYNPRYNIAPTQNVIVVNDDGQRHLQQMRWGLIPFWAKDPAIGSRMINARAETLVEKPSFRTTTTSILPLRDRLLGGWRNPRFGGHGVACRPSR